MDTQNQMILRHLQEKDSITPLEALSKYGCMRLGARIYDLRAKGYVIRRAIETHKNSAGQEKRFARYWLVKAQEGDR